MPGENDFLSFEEITELEDFISQNPQICHSSAATPTENKRITIVKVSSLTGLILVQGNKATGLQHILSRNQPASTIPYWIDTQSNNGSFFNTEPRQSKLNSVTHFLDYISLADFIYKTENLNTTKNNQLAEFDLYHGNYENIDGSTDAYNLLLYKHSKVIHTLFPQRRKPNNGENPGLTKGKVTAKWILKKIIFQLAIPYNDTNNIKRFSVLFSKNLATKTGECRIIVNNVKGKSIGFVKMPPRSFKNFISLAHEIAILQRSHLKKIEACIRYINNTLNCLK